MNTDKSQIDNLLNSLRERAKELNCLYQVEELLKDYSVNLETIFQEAIKVIPLGWRYSNYCMVRIEYKGKIYQTPNYIETNLLQSAYIAVQDIKIGSIKVSYTEEFPEDENNAFLSEENKLIISIANRLGDFILHQQLRRVNRKIKKVKSERKTDSALEWRIAIDLSRRTDSELFVRITRKMINYLVWNGVEETKEILQRIGSVDSTTLQELKDGENRPHQWTQTVSILTVAKEIYDIASENLPDEEIFACIQKWMMEDRASFLIKTLVNLNSTLGDITDAIRRFVQLSSEGIKLSEYSLKGVRVSLIRRIVTDNLEYIKIAKSFVEVSDFQDILKRMIYPMGSHGQLGGKSAGLFIAWQIIKKYQDQYPILKEVKIPKTWYITSDGFHNFMDHNDLEEVTEQKYKDLNQVRQEYQHIINLFKSSQFTPEITKGLSMALDDFGDKPIIVRSSSLLEDSIGAAFSGKYKSLFLANQGEKEFRLQALMDAIAEVYSSTFGSDPIEYRTERGLIDFKEAMGIIIQEVVGKKIGKYFFPSYAGVAFSQNEFRWSPRIKRDDGLIRIVPGLGTRAVDRLSDDFPVLVAPGQPGLRVNATPEEVIRYAPKFMDVINLESNSFETVAITDIFKNHGDEIPATMQMISVVRGKQIRQPSLLD
nr:PEP/pyruvate-binding domain-containing protein [bacterium]